MYTCGITPYDATHLGHAATYLAYDVLQRRLIDLGHRVTCVRNVTDVDDPLFAKARELGVHYLDLAAGEEARFDADMEALNALPVAVAAACLVGDPRHPRLHRHGARPRVRLRGRRVRCTSTSRSSARSAPSATTRATRCSRSPAERGGDVDNPDKRDPLDFVLWQPSAPDEPSWDTLWGPGPARLAHRVQRAGPARARHDDRPPRRRHRSDLPAPRVRAGPVRGRDRRAVRAALDAHRADLEGRREDVEEPRQPRVHRRAAQGVGPGRDPPRRSSVTTTASSGSGTTS